MIIRKHSHLIAIILSSIVWGFFAISLKKLSHYNAQVILNWRIIIAFAILWFIIILTKKQVLIKTRNQFLYLSTSKKLKFLILTLISGILLTLNWLFFIYVTNQVSLQAAAFAYITCPLITAIAGFIILKEHLNKLKIIALLLASISIVGLAASSFVEVMWSLLIAALYSFFLIIQRVLKDFDKLLMLGIQLAISMILILPKLLMQNDSFPDDIFFWIQILIIAIIFTIIPLLLSLYALKELPSSTVGIAIYINPIISYSVAYFFFNELINSHDFIYYGILLIAVIIFNGDIILNSLPKRLIKKE